MQSFVSLPKKIMLLLAALIIVLVGTFVIFSFNQSNQEFLREQLNLIKQTKVQYQVLDQLSKDRIQALFELLTNVQEPKGSSLNSFRNTLDSNLDFLEFNWQIEDIWVWNEQTELVYSAGADLTPMVAELASQVRSEQQTAFRLTCKKTCKQYHGLPILLSDNQIAVLVASTSMLETLALLNRSINATLAMVYIPKDSPTRNVKDLTVRGPISKAHLQLVQATLANTSANANIASLQQQGESVLIDRKSYLLALIPITEQGAEENYILSILDTTEISQTFHSFRRKVTVIASLVFLFSGLICYIYTNNMRTRLLDLAKRMPLLAQKQYNAFLSTNKPHKHFRDELDTLQDSAKTLALRLQQLDKDVLAKTSELEEIAMYDSLTRLANRNMLNFALTQAISELNREPNYVAILFFDLDDFKKVNDSHGHDIGDKVLVEAAERFKQVVRETDLVCRFGGDEFVVLLKTIKEPEDFVPVANKLLRCFEQPFKIEQSHFYISTSIGVAISNSITLSADDLLSHADVAMYQAKEAGGNCYRLYDQQMSQSIIEKVQLESEARLALKEEQFFFALQPQVELKHGQLVGFEALIRWRHPEKGFVPPGQFIPILENSEFMIPLGYWCLSRAFALLTQFKQRQWGDIKIAVNLAGNQFLDPGLITFLRKKLEQTQINAGLIELELTERTLVSDVARTTEIMRELSDLGFVISIDDFGTGYSSLSYLKRMPAKVIKIDRAFIDGMNKNKADLNIVASTIGMVQNLGMQVVAEGIEESEQLELLHTLNCDIAQGYYLARPIPEQALETVLSEMVAKGSWYQKDNRFGFSQLLN